jgi:hypothetical protein
VVLELEDTFRKKLELVKGEVVGIELGTEPDTI